MVEESASIQVQHDQTDCIIALNRMPKEFRKEINKGVSTGWKCLDKYLQGLRPGEVTVITADTGCGKTTFCTQLMINCAMQDISVWINSWEMRPETMLRKIASIVLRRPMKLVNFTERDNEQFDEWNKKYHIYVNPKTIGIDITTLGKQLAIAKQMGIEVIMLDHLDYLVNNRREKMHEAIEECVRQLHEMAHNLSLHILLICHPRQTANEKEEVGIHSLKGSSSIKQYADNVILLHRCARTDDQAVPGKVKVRVAKNRMFGTEGNAYLFYQSQWDGYMELNA